MKTIPYALLFILCCSCSKQVVKTGSSEINTITSPSVGENHRKIYNQPWPALDKETDWVEYYDDKKSSVKFFDRKLHYSGNFAGVWIRRSISKFYEKYQEVKSQHTFLYQYFDCKDRLFIIREVFVMVGDKTVIHSTNESQWEKIMPDNTSTLILFKQICSKNKLDSKS